MGVDKHTLNESVAQMGPARKPLVAILTHPNSDAPRRGNAAVLLLNAGLLHRVGPNRIYVKLARELAAAGFFACRLDFSGIGDSPAREHRIGFEEASCQETLEAIEHLQQTYGVHRFYVLGICSGANAALRAAIKDTRVRGVIAINGVFDPSIPEPQNRELPSHAKASARTRMRYYRKRLLNRNSLWRLLTLKSNYRKILETLYVSLRSRRRQDPSPAASKDAMEPVRDLLQRGVGLLVIFSEGSSGLDLLEATLGTEVDLLVKEQPNLVVEVLEEIDHVFTPLWAQKLLIDKVAHWLETQAGRTI